MADEQPVALEMPERQGQQALRDAGDAVFDLREAQPVVRRDRQRRQPLWSVPYWRCSRWP
jgi:hypothetical protein